MENHVLLRIEDTSNTSSSSSSSKVQEEEEKKEDDKDIDFHEKMIHLFKGLEKEKENLGIFDFSIGLPTLEEVFLELSKLEKEQDHVKTLAVQDDKKMQQFKKKAGKVTTCGQINALIRKNAAYQCTQKGQLCCMIFFPLMILALSFFSTSFCLRSFVLRRCVEMVSQKVIARQKVSIYSVLRISSLKRT